MRPLRSVFWRRSLAILVPMAFALVVLPGGAQETPRSSAEFEAFQEKRLAEFEAFRNKKLGDFEAFKREFEDYKRIVSQEREEYTDRVSERWDEPLLSSPKVWVEYSADLSERHRVDFENKTITIEVVRPPGAEIEVEGDAYRASVRARIEALVTKNRAEAFADDTLAQEIEKQSKKEIDLLETSKVPPDPILIPYLTGIGTDAAAELGAIRDYTNAIVDHMMDNLKTTQSTNSRGETVVKVEVPLETPPSVIEDIAAKRAAAAKSGIATGSVPPARLPRRASALWDLVNHHGRKAGVSNALLYAVIETESAFDPMATSWVPAYGLMQIVPESAGMDVTEELFGEARILSPSYLYIPENNILIGSTYLNLLKTRYLRGIKNRQSRLYCSVAAYNTGAHNVAKAFTGKRKIDDAVRDINGMTPEQVYNTLSADLPYDETKKYLEKVIRRIEKYNEYGV